MTSDVPAAPPTGPGPEDRAGRPIEMRDQALQWPVATPQPDRTMPGDLSLSVAALGSPDQVITRPGGPRRQPMRGFEETFTDIVDFILRCTHRIWDERSIGYLYEHYRSTTRVVDDPGTIYGRDRIIETTARTLAAYPDIRHHADEVIWCGDEDKGFWTSHRLYLIGHNTGPSQWGSPTGRRIVLMVIANCLVIENQIADEFVIHNTGSIVRQLGIDPDTAARNLAALGEVSPLVPPGEVQRRLGQGPPPATAATRSSPIEAFVRDSLHRLWNWRLLDLVDQVYAAGYRMHGPTDLELAGRGQLQSYVLSLLAMLPDLAHQIDDLYWMGNDREGYRVAVRWSIVGTHRGPGILGPPSGRQVRLWGLTHLLVREEQIIEEWTVTNEFYVRASLVAGEV